MRSWRSSEGVSSTGPAPPRDGVTVVIRDGLIASVDESPPPEGASVVDVERKTVLPGLIDAHTHLSSAGGLSRELRPYGLVDACRHLLAAGITTFRDLGAVDDSLFGLKAAAELGLCAAPRLVLCGQVISATCAGARAFPGMYREANGTDELLAAVREQVRSGAEVIKVMATGALTVAGEDVDPSQLTLAELTCLVEEAHRLGLPVASHAEGVDGIRLSVKAGADTIEHGEQGHLAPESLAVMAEHGVILVPTLSVFDYVADSEAFPRWMRERGRGLGESARKTIEAARREGVPIAMGADAPPHGGNAQEVVRLADAGLTALEAIGAATGVAARACRIEDSVGTLAPGKVADLVVVDGDPLRELGLLTQPGRLELVLQRGAVVARSGRVEAA